MKTREMDAGARGWLYRYAQRNYWRVSSWYDIDDLVQDGHMHYCRVVDRYPDAVDPPHIMRLFQITFINHINDLVKKKLRLVEVPVLDAVSSSLPSAMRREADAWDSIVADEMTHDEIAMAALVAHAPDPIKRVLDLLMTDEGCRRLRSVYRRFPGGHRETRDERIARLTGLSATIDFEKMFRAYFA